MRKESLHDAAVRFTGKKGCKGGCKDGCYFDDVRSESENKVCLIRRIAQCSNAEEQIDELRKWRNLNPPTPGWILDWNGARCSECGVLFPVERMSVNGYSVSISNPKWKFCPMCGIRMEGAGE